MTIGAYPPQNPPPFADRDLALPEPETSPEDLLERLPSYSEAISSPSVPSSHAPRSNYATTALPPNYAHSDLQSYTYLLDVDISVATPEEIQQRIRTWRALERADYRRLGLTMTRSNAPADEAEFRWRMRERNIAKNGDGGGERGRRLRLERMEAEARDRERRIEAGRKTQERIRQERERDGGLFRSLKNVVKYI